MYKGKYIDPKGMLIEPIIKNNLPTPPNPYAILCFWKNTDDTIYYGSDNFSNFLNLNPDNTYIFSKNKNTKFQKI
jgi:hypothetical protein